jgi:hypothetical protein
MVRRDLHKLEQRPRGCTYAEAENALIAALGIEAKHRALLRARLKNLQRLGLPGTAPGKGARARYTHAQVGMWLLAMLVADTGIDPTIVVQAIKARWKDLEPDVLQAMTTEALGENPIWIALWPGLAASAWKSESPNLGIQTFRLFSWPNEFERRAIEMGASKPTELAQLAMRAGDHDKWTCFLNFARPAARLGRLLPSRS